MQGVQGCALALACARHIDILLAELCRNEVPCNGVSPPESETGGTMLEVGQSVERRVRWTREDIIAFAKLVGDHNPMHHDEAYAAQTRFGELIASGCQSVAYMLAICGSLATKEDPGVGLEFTIKFLGAVRPGDEITMRWEVVSKEESERPRGTLVTLHGEAVTSEGRRIVSAIGKTLSVSTL